MFHAITRINENKRTTTKIFESQNGVGNDNFEANAVYMRLIAQENGSDAING